jgi:hypothetical protein
MKAIEPKRMLFVREFWRNFDMVISLSVDAQLKAKAGGG